MEEGKDKLYSEGTENNLEQGAQEAAPAVESAEVKPTEVAPQPTQQAAQAPRKPKKKGLTFGKAFVAALLAVVAGSALITAFWLSLFSGIGALMQPKKVAGVPAEAILHINLEEDIIDAPLKDPMAGFDIMSMQPVSQLTLYDALRSIEAAAADERVKGIYINLTGAGVADITIVEELREAIEMFKAQGKWVVAYNDVYTQVGYYLASVADKIYMQPEGTFDWSGMEMNSLFFKGLIDKLGVEVDILRPTVCKYKSAVEPYFLTKMSDANREQMQMLVDQMWGVILEGVSASRDISVEELNRLADELAVVLPQQAVEHKMIDGLMYTDQMEELFKSEYGLEKPG